jgi:hypothetical protein
MTLSLLNVGMLDCIAMDVALLYWTALGSLESGYLRSDFLGGMGPVVQAGSQKWSYEELVYE